MNDVACVVIDVSTFRLFVCSPEFGAASPGSDPGVTQEKSRTSNKQMRASGELFNNSLVNGPRCRRQLTSWDAHSTPKLVQYFVRAFLLAY